MHKQTRPNQPPQQRRDALLSRLTPTRFAPRSRIAHRGGSRPLQGLFQNAGDTEKAVTNARFRLTTDRAVPFVRDSPVRCTWYIIRHSTTLWACFRMPETPQSHSGRLR